jgi:hypothetical protein
MFASIDEPKPGSGDEVFYRARYQYLPWGSERGDASADMDRDSANVVLDLFALAGMEACTNFDPDRAHFVDDCARTANGAGGTVECNEKAIARRIGLTAAKPTYVAPDRCIVSIE